MPPILVTFNLAQPDPDFVFKLAHTAAYPVPEGVPMNELVEGAFPGTGPYMVSAMTQNEVRLARNPHFQVLDGGVRPDGFPDEIVFTVVESDAQRVAMVENGEADYTAYRGSSQSSAELFARIKTQYAGQWHPGAVHTAYVLMNSSMPPFDNVDARRAVNFALDRAHGRPGRRSAGSRHHLPAPAAGVAGLPALLPIHLAIRTMVASGNSPIGSRRYSSSNDRAPGAAVIVGPTFPQSAPARLSGHSAR